MSGASSEIDNIIKNIKDWRGEMLFQLRSIVNNAYPNITEEVKWKKPSKPEGVPVWSYEGNICIADTLKNAVRLTFPKGAKLNDTKKLFNTRLDSKTIRAIDFYENATIDKTALSDLIVQAAQLNDLN